MKIYKRDKRSPIPSSSKASYVASKIKSKNTKPELLLRKSLWKEGIRGYRLHPKSIPGKPDICFIKRKVAIFVNGCYWHRCPKCNCRIPKSNRKFWADKFQKNVERDFSKKNELEKLGFKVVICWECDVKNDIKSCIIAIKKALNDTNGN